MKPPRLAQTPCKAAGPQETGFVSGGAAHLPSSSTLGLDRGQRLGGALYGTRGMGARQAWRPRQKPRSSQGLHNKAQVEPGSGILSETCTSGIALIDSQPILALLLSILRGNQFFLLAAHQPRCRHLPATQYT